MLGVDSVQSYTWKNLQNGSDANDGGGNASLLLSEQAPSMQPFLGCEISSTARYLTLSCRYVFVLRGHGCVVDG